MINVLVIGSCVTRDSFALKEFSNFSVQNYIARSSLASALEEKIIPGIRLDAITSEFQRRMVAIDIQKKLIAILENSNPDLILIDLIDERFDIFEDESGAVCTVSNELLSSGFSPKSIKGELIKSGSPEFIRRWTLGWGGLLNVLIRRDLFARLFVNRVEWSWRLDNGDGYYPKFSDEKISSANKLLNKLYGVMEVDLPREHFLAYSSEALVGALNHRWGISPFHYVERFHMEMLGHLNRILVATNPRNDPKNA